MSDDQPEDTVPADRPSEDRDEAWGDPRTEEAAELDRLISERPPHHDR